MRRYFENLGVILGLLACGALLGVIVVTMIDPDCGPSGDEQKACMREIVRDIKGGR